MPVRGAEAVASSGSGDVTKLSGRIRSPQRGRDRPGLDVSKGEECAMSVAVQEGVYFALLRLYNPLQPFFDKTWRPSEIEPDDPD